MKFSFFTLWLIAISMSFSNPLFSQQLVLASTKMQKIIAVENHKIKVKVLDAHKQLLAESTDEAPYFEFVLNNKRYTSNSPIWEFTKQETRKMGNHGTEYQFTFSAFGKLDGLSIVIYQQVFPESTLIRERLAFKSKHNKAFRLNKWHDKLHFQFPQYQLKGNNISDPVVKEIRIATWEKELTHFANPRSGKPVNNHMFYPDILNHSLNGTMVATKGPIQIVEQPKWSWITTYEHASQDNLDGIVNRKEDKSVPGNDPLQGTVGAFNFPKQDKDLRFLEVENKRFTNGDIGVALRINRGGYLDGEVIDSKNAYSSVWATSSFFAGNNLNDGLALIRNYLMWQICENPASRKPKFYYNTWGMQREESMRPNTPKGHLRNLMTYERIFEEIDYAKELSVDLFVLDDGWQETQGIWKANKKRLSQGLAPIKARLDSLNMELGVWFSPAGIDSLTARYKQHKQWVILDSENKPILAQWGHPAFDFVSGFKDFFIAECKTLIDQGVTFFKFDAINTFYSSLPNLHHGSDAYTAAERRARYEYLLPIYITETMKELTDYNPDLVIEMDLTEAKRTMVGLAPLSQGKYFFMNNGASWYNDYTDYRTKSMRTISNVYNGIIPLELFTYANYPINKANNMIYNINTSLIAGHGFWGNLALTTPDERKAVKQKVQLSKRVLEDLTNVKTKIIGNVGDSIEVYEQINSQKGSGQIIAFSHQPIDYAYKTTIHPSPILAVLDHPYQLNEGQLQFNFSSNKNIDTYEAFVVPKKNLDIQITSSSCDITDIETSESMLKYEVAGKGTQTIKVPIHLGKPKVTLGGGGVTRISPQGNYHLINVEIKDKTTVLIELL